MDFDELDLDTKKELIRNQVYFSVLSNEELDLLVDLFMEKRVSAGETIVKEGDLVDSIYLIVSGTADVRHVRAPKRGKRLKIQSVATLEPGSSIGLSATGFYSLSGIRTATVVAKTDMVLLYLSVAAFRGFSLVYSHVSDVLGKQFNSV